MSTTIIKSANSDNQALVDDTGHLLVTGSAGNNASVGTTGVIAPTSGTEVAGVDNSGNLVAVSVDSQGRVNVNSSTSVVGTVSTQQQGLASFKTSQYTIGTMEIQITPTPLTNRSSISLKVKATGSEAIYICETAGQALTQGYPLFNGDNLQMDLTPAGNIYAIATASGQSLYVLEIA